MRNLKQFVNLIRKYRTMTPEHIIKILGSNDIDINDSKKLTGFGSFSSCTLCLSVKQIEVEWGKNKLYEPDCRECCWKSLTGKICQSGENSDTYENIAECETAEDLSASYQLRADRMVELLYNKNIINDNEYIKLKR